MRTARSSSSSEVDCYDLSTTHHAAPFRVLGQIRNAEERVKLAIDVMVMAFSALYGGALVYTSDLDDFTKLERYFPAVRVLSI
jgi:hypothetical protein